ncbi:MAG: ATP-binding protein [Terriglobia bacterium]
MAEQIRNKFRWLDILWLVFLAGLAVLPPLQEIHKQMILAGIGLFQIFERKILNGLSPVHRDFLSVLIKVLLSALLVWHTGGINSNYYPIFYLPVISAAMLYDTWGTVLWTLVSCLAYGAFLLSALRFYRLTVGGATELALRYLFFFLVAVVVNRFVSESRRQAARYRKLAEALGETNRQLEQAQADARRSERLAALGQLSAGLAHEIRNPLGVMRGSAEILNERVKSSDPVTAEMASYISIEVERLNNLVGRFLDFARPLHLKLEQVEIQPLIDRALLSARERWPDACVETERKYAPGLRPLPLDPELAESVFTNLFLNAYEAMPGGGKLRIAVWPDESDGRRGLAVEIEDTGPGIAPEQLEHIFNPFFTTKKTGLGLGLSIVSKVVDDHKGLIRLVSRPGEGACFRLFFPEHSSSAS